MAYPLRNRGPSDGRFSASPQDVAEARAATILMAAVPNKSGVLALGPECQLWS
jgi:hypothetical protein